MREKISAEGPSWRLRRELRQDEYARLEGRDVFALEEYRSFRGRVFELLREAVEEQKLPISIRFINERLAALKYIAVDPAQTFFKEKWGDFDERNHIIRLSTDIPKEDRFQAFVHEVIHALSGQIETLALDEGSGELEVTEGPYEIANGDYDQLKSGLALKNKLSWLNEALTEHITHELVGKSYAYTNERELLDLIVGHGVPLHALFAAYFENNTSEMKGHKFPATGELFGMTNKLFGTGFLMKLDTFINSFNRDEIQSGWCEEGVLKAVALWKDLGDVFPEYVLKFDSGLKKLTSR